MASIKHYVLAVIFACFHILLFCQALELEEIRSWSASRTEARDISKRDLSALDLKSIQTFLWGSEDNSEFLLGNLTVFMPHDHENILSMEKFHWMIASIRCSSHDMELKFNNRGSFAYAQKVWDWVNGADNHTFVMVTGKGDCGPNSKRTPYLVSRIIYHEKHNTAHLEAAAGTWTDLAHSYELRVGKIPLAKNSGLHRRDYTKDAYLDLAANLGTKIKVETGPINGELVCDPCHIAGKMHFELVISTWAKIPNGVALRLSPEGVKVAATLKFSFTSNFGTKTKLPPFSFPNIPLSGISIPGGILTLGPVLEITIGGEVKAEGTVSVTAGASATLPDSALLQVDLLNAGNNKFSSWKPDISAEPLEMQAKVSATWKQYLEPKLKIEAQALGQGFDAGVSLRMPFVEIKAEAIVAQNGGACTKGDPYDAAVRAVAQWGFELKFQAGKIGDENVDVTLGTAAFPIGQPFCRGWNIEQNGGNGGSPSSLPPPPTIGGGKNGNSCTNKNTGTAGTCLSTSACKDAGNESAPGYCPNDPIDIQCCTSKVGSSSPKNSCKVGDATGECISTGFCSSSGKMSTPGHCPNDPTDVQCCTSMQPSDPTRKNTCRVGDTPGECISTASCKSSGKTSTPGHCLKDPTDIQCCTDFKSSPPSKNTCNVGKAAGECISTGSCKSSGKKSTPGHCPDDPTDVQCCTDSSNNTCKIGTTAGECISTGSCKSSGKKSTPGYCPDDPTDVQCCTSG